MKSIVKVWAYRNVGIMDSPVKCIDYVELSELDLTKLRRHLVAEYGKSLIAYEVYIAHSDIVRVKQ